MGRPCVWSGCDCQNAVTASALPMGFASLLRTDASGLAQLINSAATRPIDANTLMLLSMIFLIMGEREFGLEMQAKALMLEQHYQLPAPSAEAAIRLLVIMRPGDMTDNTPLDFLLEESDVSLDMLYVSPTLPFPARLPDHDVLFVAIGESDENAALLKYIEDHLKYWPHPVLNAPDRIPRQARDRASVLLRNAAGVAIPITARVGRATLQGIGAGSQAIADILEDGEFPVIVRPLASHAGRGLMKLEEAEAIAGYLQTMTESDFYVSRFVDYRSPDGLFRKYRIVLIDGRPHACHMAISEQWMIHFKNAGMAESAGKRAEEALFMAGFDDDFARRHQEAFSAINDRMGLDYLVIDCGETLSGQLLIFEVDSGGFVHATDPMEIFPYKQPQMRKVFSAFREMLDNAVSGSRASFNLSSLEIRHE